MKIVLANGSPKTGRSASGTLLRILGNRLGTAEAIWQQWNRDEVSGRELEEIADSDAMVLAFPLYVDALPSHVLRILRQLEAYWEEKSMEKPFRVFAIVNNGFYNARQNRHAIEVVRNWCGHTGMVFAGGLCVGGGEMVSRILGMAGENGPLKPIASAVKRIGDDVLDKDHADGGVAMVEPAFPQFLYQRAGQMQWKQTAKRNGLKL